MKGEARIAAAMAAVSTVACGLSPHPAPTEIREEPSSPPGVASTIEKPGREASWALLATPGGETATCRAFWSGVDLYLWSASPGCAPRRLEGERWRAMSTAESPTVDSWFAGTAGRQLVVYGYAGSHHVAARYDPQVDAWSPTDHFEMGGAPEAVKALSAGDSLLLWGGYDHHPDDFADLVPPRFVRYDVESGWWHMAEDNMPTPRYGHGAIFDSHHMFVFGGRDYGGNLLGDWSLYDLGSNAWESIAASGAPSPRSAPAIAWTGHFYAVFGGTEDGEGFLGDGALFWPEPAWSWQPMTALEGFAPRHPAAFWTGEHVEVVQTTDAPIALARYFPVDDAWEPVAVPAALADFVVIDLHWDWAAHRALLWGHRNGEHALWAYHPPFLLDPSEGHPGDDLAGNQTDP